MNNKSEKRFNFIYELDSYTKYSIGVKKVDNMMYAKNPKCGWLRYFMADNKGLPPTPTKLISAKNVGKEVILNVGGYCDANSTTNQDNVLPMTNEGDLRIQRIYQQDKLSVDNSCVRLATCLIVRSVDENLENIIIQQYHIDRLKYEWLYMFNKEGTNNRTLFNYLNWTKECYSSLQRVKKPNEYKDMNLYMYILDFLTINSNGG